MQLTSPLEKGRKREDYLYRTDVVSTSFHPLIFFTLSPLSYLQIVSSRIVKKSEATSRECQRNRLTCFQLVKTPEFYGFVYL